MSEFLDMAIEAARRAGAIQRAAFGRTLDVDEATHHDIKLAVDKESERVIVSHLRERFSDHAILAEESGEAGDHSHRWVIDPLDGTVNFFHNIPHFAVSIALEVAGAARVGVVFDPMRDELFAAEAGEGAFLNGEPIRVNPTADPARAIVVVGLMKSDATIRAALDAMGEAAFRAQKVRVTGSAALDLAYVAAGRFCNYYECGIRPWDIAAGRALIECAGGRFEAREIEPGYFNVHASNGATHEAFAPFFPLDVTL